MQAPGQNSFMVNKSSTFDELTAEERISLIGRLWDSLDAAVAAPMSPELAAELDRREAEADADPMAGVPWESLKAELRSRLK